MVHYSEYAMECEPTMESLWGTEGALDEAFEEANSFDENEELGSSQDFVAPSHSFSQDLPMSEEIDCTLDNLLEVPLYDFEATADGRLYDDDLDMSTFDDSIAIVTPPNSGKPTYQGELPPSVPATDEQSPKLKTPSTDELTEQYTEAVARFAASMRRSEATRAEILRRKLLVRNMNGFNAGVDSRNKLWSAMRTSQPVRT